jgi:hypothetical protein
MKKEDMSLWMVQVRHSLAIGSPMPTEYEVRGPPVGEKSEYFWNDVDSSTCRSTS